jgi:hypothetical protein
MSVESAGTIVELSSTWPLNGDPILEGDDHIRLIKNMLKSQFPGGGGQGFNIPITATEVELNYSVGVSSGIQSQFDAITLDLTDNYLPLAGGTVTDQIKGVTPIGDEDLSRKDYVDEGLALKAERISTDLLFGGFRHTVVGTTLELFTTEVP